MRRAVREVALVAAIAWTVNLLSGCGSEFSAADSDGGNGNAGTGGGAGSSGGSKANTGAGAAGMGAVSGAGGTPPNPGAGGTISDAGEGGATPMMSGGAGGGDPGNECEMELLTNGGFDALSAGWEQMAQPARGLILHQSSDILMDLDHLPVSPEYMLLLGAADDDDSTVSQAISVPDAALTLVVSFYLHIHTDEDDAQVYDSLTLSLGTDDSEPVPIATYTNFDANDDWEPISFVLDATPYRDSSPTFVLRSEADGDIDTSFLLDSFSISAKLCE